MTIVTIELTQQQSYQQTSNQRQKVTLVSPATIAQDKSSVEQSLSLSSANLISSRASQISPTSSEIDEITYQKPQSAKLQLMILVLERFIGRQLELSDFGFLTNKGEPSDIKASNNFASMNELFSATKVELVTIGEQSFQQGDLLLVEQWVSREQQLSYQIQGQFKINEQELSLNYNFNFSFL